MAAFAMLQLPLDLSKRSAAAAVAASVVATYPGTRNVELDSGTSRIRFEMQFPGNLSGLVRSLRAAYIYVGERAAVMVHVRNIVPEIMQKESDVVHHRLLEGPEVLDPEIKEGKYVLEARVDGDWVEAAIVPSSNSMHELYDSLLTLGLVASDEAEVSQGSATGYAKAFGLT